MNLIESVQKCYKNYANFEGRATRSEFWYFYLFFYLTIILGGIISSKIDVDAVYGIVAIFLFGSIIPSAALTARRLHDVGKSGWWQVLGFIPYVNIIALIPLIFWFCSEGEKNKNKYGPPIKINERKR